MNQQLNLGIDCYNKVLRKETIKFIILYLTKKDKVSRFVFFTELQNYRGYPTCIQVIKDVSKNIFKKLLYGPY